MDIEKLKASIIREIDAHQEELRELSLRIHGNPELGFKEIKAAGWLTGYLGEKGFLVERGIGKLPTAFRASYGKGKPAIAILAEYDALPEIGHACGHNLIAGCAVGAGIAAKLAVDQFGGEIMIVGTPGEELYGGKALMAKQGLFNNLEAAMMVHPGANDNAVTYALASQALYIEFFGKPAHAAARPEMGINALEAMIQSFTAINSLRQHIKSSARIHGIITSGGEAANIVPAHSAGNFLVRADDDDYLEELKGKVLNCFIGAAAATGARLEYKWDKVKYAPMRNNLTLAKLFLQNMRALGRKLPLVNTTGTVGSTDMGNVSQVTPSIHPSVAISNKKVGIHTSEFVTAAGSEKGIEGMLDAAKALAMTAADLFSDPEIVTKVKEEFERGK